MLSTCQCVRDAPAIWTTYMSPPSGQTYITIMSLEMSSCPFPTSAAVEQFVASKPFFLLIFSLIP
jgi:hypothetical protein